MIAAVLKLHPSVRLRLLTAFLSKVFSTAVLPFMGLLFAQRSSVTTAGILLVAHYAVQFGVGLYGGVLSDALGRKRVMVWGEGTKSLAFMLMLLASVCSGALWPIFLGTLVLAAGNGLASPAGDALLIDASRPEDRAFMYAVTNWGHNLGYLIGAPVGALLFRDHLPMLLVLLSGMALLIWWVTLRYIQDVEPPAACPRWPLDLRALGDSYRQVASDRTFLGFTLGGVLILSTEFARTTFLGIRLDEAPGPALTGAHALALMSAENTLMIVLGTALVARFLRGQTPRHWMLVGAVLFGGGYCAVMVLDRPWALLLAGAVCSVGELLYVPTRQAVLAGLTDSRRRGAYMAVNGMVYQFAKILASCGLIVWPLLGQSGLLALMVGFTAVGSLLGWSMGTRRAASAVFLPTGVSGD